MINNNFIYIKKSINNLKDVKNNSLKYNILKLKNNY